MPPALDQLEDAPLSLLAAFTRAVVHADIDLDVLKTLFEDPRQIATTNAEQMPAMAIYRWSERRRQRNSQQNVQDIVVVWDYCVKTTSPDRRRDRWPVLQAVWNAIADAMIVGHHAAFNSDAKALKSVGLQLDRNSPDVTYGFAERRIEYPYFRGAMKFTFTPEDANWADYDLYLRHVTTFDVPGGDYSPSPTWAEGGSVFADTTILPPYTGS